MRAGWMLALLIGGPAQAQDLIGVPSGQPVTLQDVIWNEPGPAGLTARFRFIAPEIAREGGSIDYDTAAADMDFLCDSYALPRLDTITGPRPAQVVISLSDIAVDFGVMAPEATQFFEAYSIGPDGCVWEAF